MRRATATKIVEEFCLINVPIFIYVLIEAHHRGQGLLTGIVASSEWCIGTVVMSFQAVRFYLYGTWGGPRKSPGVFVVLLLFAMTITAMAFYLLNMHQRTDANITLMWVAFLVASLFFVLFGGAGLWGEAQYSGE